MVQCHQILSNFVQYDSILFVQSCTILYNLVQLCPILYKFFQSCTILSNLVHFCLILSNVVQSCSILLHIIQCLPISSSIIQSCPSCLILCNLVQSYVILCNLVQSCAILCSLVQSCAILSNCHSISNRILSCLISFNFVQAGKKSLDWKHFLSLTFKQVSKVKKISMFIQALSSCTKRLLRKKFNVNFKQCHHAQVIVFSSKYNFR